MNRNILLSLLVGAIFLGWVGIIMVVNGSESQPDILTEPNKPSQPDTSPQSTRVWEYKTICVQGPFTMAAQTLNEYGKKGWEVVDWEDTGFLHFLLKRQASN